MLLKLCEIVCVLGVCFCLLRRGGVLGLVFRIDLEGFLPLFDPQKGAHYFNDSGLFESSTREYLAATFGDQWAGKFCLKDCEAGGVHWYDDYRSLMARFRNGRKLGDGLVEVERWCSLESYAKIAHNNFYLRYPPEEGTSDLGASYPVFSIFSWSISRDGDSYQLHLVGDGGGHFNQAFCNLILSHLFFNFHAMFSEVVGYRLIPGECVAKGGGDFYLRLQQRGRGTPPRFCSNVCRNRENVRLHRARKREAVSSKTQSDRANSVVSGKSLVGGRDWQSQGMPRLMESEAHSLK